MEIKAYKASDGTIFEDKVKFEAHEKELCFDDWYERHTLLGNSAGSKVNTNDIKEWLKINAEILKYYLET
jgi:hypothetical protein